MRFRLTQHALSMTDASPGTIKNFTKHHSSELLFRDFEVKLTSVMLCIDGTVTSEVGRHGPVLFLLSTTFVIAFSDHATTSDFQYDYRFRTFRP